MLDITITAQRKEDKNGALLEQSSYILPELSQDQFEIDKSTCYYL